MRRNPGKNDSGKVRRNKYGRAGRKAKNGSEWGHGGARPNSGSKPSQGVYSRSEKRAPAGVIEAVLAHNGHDKPKAEPIRGAIIPALNGEPRTSRDARVIMLAVACGADHNEIATILGITPAQLRKNFRKELDSKAEGVRALVTSFLFDRAVYGPVDARASERALEALCRKFAPEYLEPPGRGRTVIEGDVNAPLVQANTHNQTVVVDADSLDEDELRAIAKVNALEERQKN